MIIVAQSDASLSDAMIDRMYYCAASACGGPRNSSAPGINSARRTLTASTVCECPKAAALCEPKWRATANRHDSSTSRAGARRRGIDQLMCVQPHKHDHRQRRAGAARGLRHVRLSVRIRTPACFRAVQRARPAPLEPVGTDRRGGQ